MKVNSIHFVCFHDILKHCSKKRTMYFYSLPDPFFIVCFVGFSFAFLFPDKLWGTITFIEKKKINQCIVCFKKHRCWTLRHIWMCKVCVLMQSSPFRWKSKPVALIFFFNSSLVHGKYTLPQVVNLFEASGEMFSIIISLTQRSLLFLCNFVYLLASCPGAVVAVHTRQVLSEVMHIWKLDSHHHCAILELPMILIK